jgi:hypothetical protein
MQEYLSIDILTAWVNGKDFLGGKSVCNIEDLTESPGLRFLNYGLETSGTTGKSTGKEGYWNNAMMVRQTEDYMDAFETIYPEKQLAIQFDWSSGHAAVSGDGLAASKMNFNWGGKNADAFCMRDSKLTAEMIGPHPTTVTMPDSTVVDYGLKVGDVQSFTFRATVAGHPPPLPPWYDLDAPRCSTTSVHAVANTTAGVAVDTAVAVDAVIGFEGKPKGTKQVLFETGWWDPDPAVKMIGTMPQLNRLTGMRKSNGKKPPMKEHVADLLLGSRPDFRDELSELQKVVLENIQILCDSVCLAFHPFHGFPNALNTPHVCCECSKQLVHNRGHILVMSPKCHPELAGLGIEYCWGASKMAYRRDNDLNPKTFDARVDASLAKVTRRHVHLFERRARAYRTCLSDSKNDTFRLLEKAVKIRKAHRNAHDFDGAFIRSSMSEVDALECAENRLPWYYCSSRACF